jgi:putative transposase
MIQDSTIVRLHSSLAEKFPAARTRKVAACVKIGVMVSAVANGPKTVALYSEKTAEIKTLKIGPGSKTIFFLLTSVFTKLSCLPELLKMEDISYPELNEI